MSNIHQFVHLGDLHLRPNARNAQRLAALDQVIEEGLQLPDLGAWLWPGDLNHGRMSIDDRNALGARLQWMANRAPVVICYGNHDAPGDLDIFEKITAQYAIHVVRDPGVILVPLATDVTAAIFVLPYPSKGALLTLGSAGEDPLIDAQDILTRIWEAGVHHLATHHAQSRPCVMIGHVNVAGSIASTGQPQIGTEIELTREMLAQLGVLGQPIYRGLNHIHKAQKIGGAYYAGSMCRLDWGEVEEKRYLVIEYQRDGAAWEWRVGSRPIHVPPMWHVEGELTEDNAMVWQVRVGADGATINPPDSWAGAEVRVRYRYPAAKQALINEDAIRTVFAGAARLQLEPIPVASQALRAPAVAAATTLVEKLEAWADLAKVPFTASQREKLTGLSTADAVALLNTIEQQLQGDAA